MRGQCFFWGIFLGTAGAMGQGNTEIYLFDLSFEKDTVALSNPKNISNNEGYDNQPSFLDDHTVLFSSNRGGQTDILQFNITEGSTSQWLTNTQAGSEYSPMKIPGKNAISAIRLDLDGLQRLYQYPLGPGDSTPISDLKIGYHLWLDRDLLLATVLVDNRMDLVLLDLGGNTHQILWNNVGRSLHRIPGSRRISFISKAKGPGEIMSLDPGSGEIQKLADCLDQGEDINWLDGNTLITGSGKRLMTLDLGNGTAWAPIMEFGEDQIHNISRIAINPGRNRLAFVAEESPATIVQKQQDAFNSGNLEKFIAWYAEDVVVRGFPNRTIYSGRAELAENHRRLFNNILESKVEMANRMVIGNMIIDEEITTVDGRKGHQVALYEVGNGRITHKTLIFPDQPTLDSETIVKAHLEAFNQGDMDGYLAHFAENIKWYRYPDTLYASGTKNLQDRLDALFGNGPPPRVTLKNHIVIGNKVLVDKVLTQPGGKTHTVDIYEVEQGMVTKVTSIQ